MVRFAAGLWRPAQEGFTDQKIWGLRLLAIVLYGPGKLSLDHVLQK